MGVLSRETIIRLWKEQGAALVLYARQLCDTPEDIVQEAFLSLVEEPRELNNPTAWLYRVVRNGAIDAKRSLGRQLRRNNGAAAENESWFKTSPEDRLDAAAAAIALKELPIDQREVIVAKIWGGLSFEEIGSLRNLSASTVFRCYHQGLSALRERLGAGCATKPMNKT